MPSFLNEQFQLPQGKAGILATGCSQTASLIGVLIGGVWADRWSRVDNRGRVFVPIVGLLIAAPAILVATGTNILPLALAGLVAFGLTIAFNDANMMPILCQVADGRYRATGYGILNLFGCVIGGLSIYAGGVLRDANVNVSVVFRCATIGLALCVVLLLRIAHALNSNPASDVRFDATANPGCMTPDEAPANH
jgi:MFS family permease